MTKFDKVELEGQKMDRKYLLDLMSDACYDWKFTSGNLERSMNAGDPIQVTDSMMEMIERTIECIGGIQGSSTYNALLPLLVELIEVKNHLRQAHEKEGQLLEKMNVRYLITLHKAHDFIYYFSNNYFDVLVHGWKEEPAHN